MTYNFGLGSKPDATLAGGFDSLRHIEKEAKGLRCVLADVTLWLAKVC